MHDFEPEEFKNDLEVEIIDLEASDDVPEHSTYRVPEPLKRFGKNFSLRWPIWRWLTAGGIFLLVFVVILESFPSALGLPSGGPGDQESSDAPISHETDRFYIDAAVPWAVVSIDEKPVHLPLIGSEAPLKLAPGRHYLKWRAAPFQLQDCIISVPSAVGDTCHIAFGETTLLPMHARIILFRASLTTLSSDKQMALIETMQQALQAHIPSETIHPGEQYITSQGIATAKQALNARLHFYLDTSMRDVNDTSCLLDVQTMVPQACQIGRQNCLQLCTASWQYRQSLRTEDWVALAIIHAAWDYTTMQGQLIAYDQPFGLNWIDSTENLLLLRIAWNGLRWNVQPLLGPNLGSPVVVNNVLYRDTSTFLESVQLADDPACVSAQSFLAWDLEFRYKLSSSSQIRFISGPDAASGCLVQIYFDSSLGTSWSGPLVASYLERFGVLRTVNDAAHQLQPDLPRIDSYEQNIVHQLIAFPGQLVPTFF